MTTPINYGKQYLPVAGEGTVPVWTGTYDGTVVNNHDPLGVGRLQLNVPQVLGNAVSPWAVPNGSYYTIPNINTTVSVVFLGGDPSKPAWTGPLDLSPIIVSAAPPTVSYQSTPPANPRVGDIWYQTYLNSSSVPSLQQPQVWTFNPISSTFSWVQQGGISSSAISAGTVVAGIVDATTVTAATFNGSTFNGTNFTINSSGEFYYSGTPAAGNMVMSLANAAGTDSHTNAYLAGITTYRNLSGTYLAANMNPSGSLGVLGGMVLIYSATTEAGPWTLQSALSGSNTGTIWLQSQNGDLLQLANGGTVTIAPNTGQGTLVIQNGTGTVILKGTTAGVPQVNNGNDVQDYFLGHSLKRVGANTGITSTTPTTLVTFTQVNTGYYRVRARIPFTSGTGTTQPFAPRIAGNCTLDNVAIEASLMQVNVSGANLVTSEITAQNTDPTTNVALGNSSSYRWELEGFVHVSAIGNLLLTGRQGTSSASEQFTVGANAWMEIAPAS